MEKNLQRDCYGQISSLERWSAMVALVTLGGLVYAVATLVTGAFRLGDIRQLIRRPTKAK